MAQAVLQSFQRIEHPAQRFQAGEEGVSSADPPRVDMAA